MISHGHQLSPPSCRNSPQKTGKTEQLYKTFPPTPPKKNNHFYIDKPHTYLTQTYPNLIYSLMYKHLGGWILVSRVWNFPPPKSSAEWTKKLLPPPASTSPLRCRCGPVGRQYVEGGFGRLRGRKMQHRGYRGDQGHLHFGGYGCPSNFLEDDAGSFWSFFWRFLGWKEKTRVLSKLLCFFLNFHPPFVQRWVFSSNLESFLHILWVKIPNIFQSTTFSYSCVIDCIYIEFFLLSKHKYPPTICIESSFRLNFRNVCSLRGTLLRFENPRSRVKTILKMLQTHTTWESNE